MTKPIYYNRGYCGDGVCKYAVGSTALANIIYKANNTFDYKVSDGSGVIPSGDTYISNKGSSSTSNDMAMSAGRGISLDPTQSFVVTANYILWYSLDDKKHYMTTTSKTFVNEKINSILLCSNEITAAHIAIFDANPNLVGKLALSGTGTINEVDLVLGVSDAWYPCMEKSVAYFVDARAGYGTNISALSSTAFSGGSNISDIWTYTNNTGSRVNLYSRLSETNPKFLNVSNISAGIWHKFKMKGRSTSLNAGFGFGGGGWKPDNYEQNFTQINTWEWFEFYGISNGINTAWVKMFSEDLNTVIELDLNSIEVRSASTLEISNFTASARIAQQSSGIQHTAFEKDALGVPTSYDDTALNFDIGSGDTHFNPSLESSFWIEEIVDGVIYQHDYDGVNLTTYTDNVSGVSSSHSPEDADYILGKGVYPKVESESLIDNVCSYFSVYTGDVYTSYDQTARYAELSL